MDRGKGDGRLLQDVVNILIILHFFVFALRDNCLSLCVYALIVEFEHGSG